MGQPGELVAPDVEAQPELAVAEAGPGPLVFEGVVDAAAGAGFLRAFDAFEGRQVDAPVGARGSLGDRQRLFLRERRPRGILGEHLDKPIGFASGRECDPRLVSFLLLEVADCPTVGVKDTPGEQLPESLRAAALELDELLHLRREVERGRLPVAFRSPTEAFGRLPGRGQRPFPVHADVERDDGESEREVDEREDSGRNANHNGGNPKNGPSEHRGASVRMDVSAESAL